MKTLTRVLIVLLVLSLVTFLPSVPDVQATTYRYTIKGLYNEQGTRDGNVSVTLYRPENTSLTFVVDGSTVIDEPVEGTVLKFDLGYNESRTFYLKANINETIHVFTPDEPYYTYFFSIFDVLGVDNGYLESLLNINGTDLIMERWSIDTINEMPFTMSWGTAYKMRLVCDRGTYYYAIFIAGQTQNQIFPITEDMFPVVSPNIGDVSVSVSRGNETHVRSIYFDSENATDTITMSIYGYGSEDVIDSVNTTGQALTWDWYMGDGDVSYYVDISAVHSISGSLRWRLTAPKPFATINPWLVLDDLIGTSLPVLPSVAVGYLIVLFVSGIFSKETEGIGMIIVNVVAAILTYIGWIPIPWTWIGISFTMSFVIALSKGDG